MKSQIENRFRGHYLDFYSKFLPNPKRIGGHEYQAICPFHDDTKPSLNFSNERGTYFCHGCGKKGNAFHFYAKIHNLDDRKDFPKVLKGIASDFGIPWEEKQRKLIKTYNYTDAEGYLLFQVCRFDPKEFGQRRPDGRGGWIWKLDGIKPVLYRLPAVLKADEVLIVEGEKDVDNLMQLGFAATTNPMGAGKWRDEFNETLKGKNIVLIPDNDQAGREHMTKVVISLNGNSKGLKWLDLPGLSSKGDVSDWIASFPSPEEAAERLSIMITEAEPYSPPKPKTLEDVILTAVDFSLLELAPRAEYLKPWLLEDSINLFAGWRGLGKTWFAMGLCNALTKQEPFGPWECPRGIPVLLLDGEMAASDIKSRIISLNLCSERPFPLHIYSDALANKFGLPKAHLANETWRTKMEAMLKARHIKLWVVDNLASLAPGLDENSRKDWDPINQWLLSLRFAGISTLMLHHTNREGTQRGTSAREDNIEISGVLRYPADYTTEDGCRFILHFNKTRPVSPSALSLVGDMELSLIEGKDGKSTWTWANVKKKTKNEILILLNEGLSQADIAESLKVDKSLVSRVRKNAIEEGILSKIGKLTQTGFARVKGEEF